jgi:hypothetical protein
MVSCRRAAYLTSQAFDRPLRWWERLAWRAHLAWCQECRRYRRQVGGVREAAGALQRFLEKSGGDAPALSAESKRRIAAALRRARSPSAD